MKADDSAMVELVHSLEALNEAIVRPIETAKARGDVKVPEDLNVRVEKIKQ